jgi:hypothetical protein
MVEGVIARRLFQRTDAFSAIESLLLRAWIRDDHDQQILYKATSVSPYKIRFDFRPFFPSTQFLDTLSIRGDSRFFFKKLFGVSLMINALISAHGIRFKGASIWQMAILASIAMTGPVAISHGLYEQRFYNQHSVRSLGRPIHKSTFRRPTTLHSKKDKVMKLASFATPGFSLHLP